jgi:hypothetical protein
MNMIQKMYDCAVPVYEGVVREYQVSAWMAMGSDTVNIRLRDDVVGWYELTGIQVEKLSDYARAGVKTMDDLIRYLYWVIPA